MCSGAHRIPYSLSPAPSLCSLSSVASFPSTQEKGTNYPAAPPAAWSAAGGASAYPTAPGGYPPPPAGYPPQQQQGGYPPQGYPPQQQQGGYAAGAPPPGYPTTGGAPQHGGYPPQQQQQGYAGAPAPVYVNQQSAPPQKDNSMLQGCCLGLAAWYVGAYRLFFLVCRWEVIDVVGAVVVTRRGGEWAWREDGCLRSGTIFWLPLFCMVRGCRMWEHVWCRWGVLVFVCTGLLTVYCDDRLFLLVCWCFAMAGLLAPLSHPQLLPRRPLLKYPLCRVPCGGTGHPTKRGWAPDGATSGAWPPRRDGHIECGGSSDWSRVACAGADNAGVGGRGKRGRAGGRGPPARVSASPLV